MAQKRKNWRFDQNLQRRGGKGRSSHRRNYCSKCLTFVSEQLKSYTLKNRKSGKAFKTGLICTTCRDRQLQFCDLL